MIINAYEKASGQQVKFNKNELTFSKNVRENVKELIQERMRVEAVESFGKYLELPAVIGK